MGFLFCEMFKRMCAVNQARAIIWYIELQIVLAQINRGKIFTDLALNGFVKIAISRIVVVLPSRMIKGTRSKIIEGVIFIVACI